MNEFLLLKQKLPQVQRNISLKPYTTFRIGGRAKYFFAAKTKGDIQKAVHAARELRIPFFILSGGSNVIISEKGFAGLVIHVRNTKYKIQNMKLYVEAGTMVSTIVAQTGKAGLSGFEWAGGLPGTVGGAIRGNAGAFGGETKDNVLEVEALDRKGEHRVFKKKQCGFSYRSSLFKKKDFVVLSGVFQLEKGGKKIIQSIAKDHIRYRRERHPLEYPNAGSIFKNCDAKQFSKKEQEEMKDVIKTDPFPVVPTAYIISRARLQGLRIGGAQVSEKHPNYIVNRGNATSRDVAQLIKEVKRKVKQKFGIELEEEVQFIE